MNIQELFISANDELTDVIHRIGPEEMDTVVADKASWLKGLDLRRIMNISAYENACVPDVLAGNDRVVSNFDFKDDLLLDNPRRNYDMYAEIANNAVRNADDLGRTVHISYGDFPARDYLRDIIINRAIGALDIAKALGHEVKFPKELTQALWDLLEPMAGPLREYGIFGPEVKVSADAPLQERLLGLTGRKP